MGWQKVSAAVGREGVLTTQRERLKIRVRIVDARKSYGRVDYLVEAIEGSGRAWVSSKRVRLSRASRGRPG
jgi:hypothetical protein